MSQQSLHRTTRQAASAQSVYAMAGVMPGGIDVLGVYDSFSPLALYTLEEFGFCGAGEGLDWVQGGRLDIGGDMPTNTNGGQLSHAQVNGWGQIRELVQQLRGQADGRQVGDARTAMWATVGGDALIFERG
jgi:acetyl-CoA acetyltransferase